MTDGDVPGACWLATGEDTSIEKGPKGLDAHTSHAKKLWTCNADAMRTAGSAAIKPTTSACGTDVDKRCTADGTVVGPSSTAGLDKYFTADGVVVDPSSVVGVPVDSNGFPGLISSEARAAGSAPRTTSETRGQ